MIEVVISDDLLNLPDTLARAAREAQRAGADQVLNESRESLKSVGAFATGGLSNSGRVEPAGNNTLAVKFDSPADIIERGRRPGPVPRWSVFEPMLRAWANAKGLSIDNLYPIALKIRREGFKGRYPFRQALEDRGQRIERAINEPFREAL